MSFKLSGSILAGLNLLTTEVNLESTKLLIQNSVQRLLLGYKKDLTSSIHDKDDIIKQCEASILTLYSLAIKNNYDSENLKNYLEIHSIPNPAITELVDIYSKYSNDLNQKAIDNHIKTIPNVSDIDWNVSYSYKTSGNELKKNNKSNDVNNDLNYKINFGNYNNKNGERRTITEFECNTEELQSLVNKLKEIEIHCEKLCQK